uniref:CRIB domain-containing protein n=1 Tax=Poecilia mexicana TaxID=48701 RepID=A0A3B3XNP3_9TELE
PDGPDITQHFPSTMSLGKLPGIKGLVSGSQGKRRFKSDLSVDMISPPLGDFRHTMHVGRGGDVFGDTSFLSNYGGIQEPGSPDSSSSSKSTGFFTRTFRHVRRTSVPRPRSGSRDLSSPPPDISPIIKNAISLPQLNIDSVNGFCFHFLSPGVQSGFLTLPRVSRLERQIQDGDVWRTSPADNGCGALTRSDSLASFTVDLGPSLMTEVSLTETPVQTPTASSPNPSQCSASFRSKVNGRVMSTWREQKEDWGSVRTNDVTSCSSHKEESSIEAERFQRAADVLARHYGGGSFTRGTRTSQKTPHGLSEEEEEIKSHRPGVSSRSPPLILHLHMCSTRTLHSFIIL